MPALCEVCTLIPAVQKHHVSYFPEITKLVCERCHLNIHSGKYPHLIEQYIKYTPGDAKIFYSQKSRIEKFLTHLSRRKHK